MELTNRQIEQQDAVDNAILFLLQDLFPFNIEYDSEIVGPIRDFIFDRVKEKYTQANEMEFYPYLEGNDECQSEGA